MAIIHRCLIILYCLVFFCFFCIGICYAESTLMAGQVMSDYQFLDSPNKRFRLRFFSPDFTSNRYLGIQFMNFNELKLVWVANRENPLTDTSGVLNITQDGNMIISDGKGTSISLNSKQPVINGSSNSNTSLSLLDSGNLVLRSRNQTMWQSFDYPSDTWLPGMKLGLFGLKTGKPQSRILTSWISPNAPAAGPYTLAIDPNNTNRLVVWRRGVLYWRSEMWNGKNFSYFSTETQEYDFNFSYLSNENDSYFTFSPIEDNNRSVWIGINSSGSFDLYKRFSQSEWAKYSTPNCDVKNGELPQGCEMAKPSNCKGGDEFPLVTSGMMSEWDDVNNSSLSLSDCKEICKNRCSCTAYSSAHSDGTGCRFSQGQKLDFPDSLDGESFYIRNGTIVDKDQPMKRRRLWLIIGGPVVSLVVVSLLSLLCYMGRRNCCFGDKKRSSSRGDTELIMNELGASMAAIDKLSGAHNVDFSGKKDHELHLFNFSSIQVATDHFSDANKLGQGGFGPVYKGKLVDGQEIAVKRLSRTSGQGLEEFKNEVILISKLQHRNLVTLLGCCIQGEERILIYEYLPNKSLDYFLFDATKRALLDWKKRSSIITGIAQGLLYLHKYSKLRIIHRDLKTSNILLDNNMNPKISDFGTARIFGEDESRANTNRIVGTYGYMSPEYAMDGLFSVKSDVFSFGVMMLEIVSGKKNTGFYQANRYLNLLGYAWDLWKEGRCLELMQQVLLDDSCSTDDVMRCVQVGLLCVQENAANRPTMSDVMSMLSHELVNLPAPKQPAFLTISSVNDNAVLIENPRSCSINDVTTSEIQAR